MVTITKEQNSDFDTSATTDEKKQQEDTTLFNLHHDDSHLLQSTPIQQASQNSAQPNPSLRDVFNSSIEEPDLPVNHDHSFILFPSPTNHQSITKNLAITDAKAAANSTIPLNHQQSKATSQENSDPFVGLATKDTLPGIEMLIIIND